MADKKQQVIDIIKEMSVIELSELVKELEELFGVTAAAPVAAVAAAVGWVRSMRPTSRRGKR